MYQQSWATGNKLRDMQAPPKGAPRPGHAAAEAAKPAAADAAAKPEPAAKGATA
jgi:hypothetical protein